MYKLVCISVTGKNCEDVWSKRVKMRKSVKKLT